MAIDNFCEGKNMEEYEVLKKAAAELNEIMHAAHINASDRAVYASGMLLAMHVLTPDSLYATEDTASHYIYRHLMDFLKDQLSPEMYQMTAREFQVLTSDPERDRYLEKLHGSYTQYIFCFIYQNIFRLSDGMDSIGELFGEFLKYTVQMATENGKVLTPSYISLDQITDSGCDWNYETHLKIDGKVTKKDLSSEVANALLEKIKDLLKPEGDGEISADRKLFSIEELFEVQNSIYYRGMPEADLYDADGTVPVITNTALNNGVKGYSRLEACNKGNVITLSDTIGGSPVFYQEKDFIGFAHLKMLIPKKNTLPDFDGLVGRYIAVSIRKSISGRYNYTTKLNTGNILRTKISLPCKDGLVDTDFIRKIMTEEQKRSAGLVLDYLRSFSEQ